MAENRTTLQAIADELGISKVTVSRALKGQSGVSEDLRRRVQDLARDMGYVKDKLRTEARTLRLAFVTPTRYFLATDNFYQTIYYHLNDRCHEASLDLSVFVIPPEDEAAAKLPQRLCAEEPDGIFLGGEMGEAFLGGLAGIGAPLVSIDFAGPLETVDSIVVDNFRLGEAAARYLLDRGYRRIGFVGGRAYSSNVADRYYGYRKILDQAGIPPEESWLIDNADHSTGHYTLDFPLPRVMPQAFVCHCDRAAYYAIQRLRSEGFRVPEDVAIVSFDNTELASSCRPTLSSFDISKKRFADEAFRLMRERLDGYSGSARRVYLESAIVERESAPVATP